ncbi:MAG: nucleotide exchange factor GrpE [Eubacterium sp.]|nr:nucleotide exchange factor GrpE [Eubacterium sp.]
MAKEKKKPESEEVLEEKTDVEVEQFEEKEENPLEKELNDTKEQLLRVTAEYANFRKRSEKEKSETYNFAASNVIGEILPVIDNIERAISDENGDYEGLKKGVQLTYDGLLASLEKLGVTSFGEAGEQFDPNLHNAVMHVEDESLDANVITDVFQKGYSVKGKVIRPAMVKTAN